MEGNLGSKPIPVRAYPSSICRRWLPRNKKHLCGPGSPEPGPQRKITIKSKENRVSTTQVRYEYSIWSGKRGSNPPPPPWQGGALPNELFPHIKLLLLSERKLLYMGRREMSRYIFYARKIYNASVGVIMIKTRKIYTFGTCKKSFYER